MAASSKLSGGEDWAAGMVVATHPFPALMMAVAGTLTFLIADRAGSYARAIWLFVTIVLVHASIGAMNDWVDATGDRLSNPNKPLVRGVVSRQQVLLLWLIAGAAGVVSSAALAGAAGGIIAVVVLAAGAAYNFGLKGTWLSWLPYAVFIPSVVVWAFVAAGASSPVVLVTYPLGATMALALNLANTIPDLEGDAKLGLSGLAHQLGAGRSRQLIVSLYVVAGAGLAAIEVWAGLPLLAALSFACGAAAGLLLLLFFGSGPRPRLRAGWYVSTIAAALLAASWAFTLDTILRARA
jgi:4-hydroxybenzoate polyprenyltransferase